MRRSLAAALYALSLFSLDLFAAGSEGPSWSGTYRGRVLAERFLHNQSRRRPVAALTQQGPSNSYADRGQIAIIDTSGGVVAEPNFLDLQGASVFFTPSGDSYLGEARPVAFDQTARVNGVPLALEDDDSQRVVLPFVFPYFGGSYGEVFVNSDGNLTFGSGDEDTDARSLPRAVAGAPRIAPLYVDFDPAAITAQVRAYVLSDRVVVTWDGVPEFGSTRRQTFQVELQDDGAIAFHYLSISLNEAIVGIFPGGGVSEPDPVDLSETFEVGPGGGAELFVLFRSLDPMTATRRFYANHADVYDFVFLFNNFGLSAGPGTFAFELNVRNDIVGIGDVLVGEETFDLGAEFGSAKRLVSFLSMGSLSAYPDDPKQRIPIIGENNTLSVMGQEAGHRWGIYTQFLDPATNEISDALLGRGDAHWSFFFNSQGSVIEGSDILDKGAGTSPRFITREPVARFGEFDQYIMGLRAPEEVAASFLVEQPQGAGSTNPGRIPQSGVTFDGIRKNISIADIVAAEGPRKPDQSMAPRSFNFAFVLLVEEGSPAPSDEDIAKIDLIRREWETFFEQATGYRAEAATELRRGLHLSVWPRTGILVDRTTFGVVSIDKPLEQDLSVAVGSDSAAIFTPGFVTIRKGQTSAYAPFTGAFPGTATLQATASTTGIAFDSPAAKVRVLPADGPFVISILSGANQQGVAGAPLSEPIVARVTDGSQTPISGIAVLAQPSDNGQATVLGSPTGPDGRVEISWTLASSSAPNTLTLRVPGTAATAAVSAKALIGQPAFAVAGVVNAASFAAAGVSPGSIATVFGANLAATTASAEGFPLPRTLAGTQVFVDGVPVPLFFVSRTQINFQVPFGIASNNAVIQVVSSSGSSGSIAVPVAQVQPGLFFAPASGIGAMSFAADGLNSTQRAARPGEWVELFGVGLGAVSSAPEVGEPASGFFLARTVLEPTFSIGGRILPATFSGLAPGFAGLYQINFALPQDLLPGRYELLVTVDGINSNAVFLDVE
ncbi:MAG: hypothetical protein O3A53_02655 [Acidobacteria bacterium]|nr:hypothetical protein [Acidobacteriota bacterium]MDA1233681.1 hypothetical protein [Acidobacteriota bacterium]